MEKRLIRVGLIGLGGMANHHIGLLASIPEAEIAAICDFNEDALNKAGEKLPAARRFKEYAALIADTDVDCVISIVPNKYHAEILELCIEHGKPCMTEKPFTVTFEEAERLKELYERAPIPCMVGFSYRYIPAFRMAKQWIEEGELGEVRHISIQYLQQWGAEMFEVPFSWRFSKEMSGSGALGDLGAHMIDAARYFAGEIRHARGLLKTFIPERTQPRTDVVEVVDVDDYAAFVADFESGAAGVFSTSRNAIGFGNFLEVTIFGTERTIQVNSEYPREVKKWEKREGEVGSNLETVEVDKRFELNQLQDFLNFLRGEGSPDLPDFWDGYRNQAVLDMIIRSSEQGA